MGKRKAIATAVVAFFSVVLAVLGTSPAQAARYNNCEADGLCLYYNTGFQGAHVMFTGDLNYSGTYPNNGTGAGKAIKNGAATGWNYNASLTYGVYYNSNQDGAFEYVFPQEGPSKDPYYLNWGACWNGGVNDWSRFCYTYNDNASQAILWIAG